MSELKVKNITLTASTLEKVEFDVKGYEFLVKNFNDFDIYVAFEETTDTEKMIKIPANCGQVCLINKSTQSLDVIRSDIYIYATSSGEVEVQCLKF